MKIGAKQPISEVRAERICLVKPSALGDIVQSLPVLQALRSRFPRAHLAWVAEKAYAPLLEPIPILDEVIPFERDMFRSGWIAGVRKSIRFARLLAEKRFDLVVDLQGLLRSGVLTLATRAPVRIGLQSAREGAGVCYTHRLDDLSEGPGAVVRYWSVAKALGVGNTAKRFSLGLTAEERQRAELLLSDLPRPLLAIHPGARWQTKRWPAESFAEAARRILQTRHAAVVVLGGPGDADLATEITHRLGGIAVGNVRNLAAAGLTLRELAATLEQVDVLLANDSGPAHLAAAVGTRTVTLFTCTDPERAAPFGPGHRVVQTTVPCRASYLKQCDRMVCMQQLVPESIVPILSKALPLPRDDRAA